MTARYLMQPVKGVLMPRLPLPRPKFLLTQINNPKGNFAQGNTMRGVFNILSPWKVILLFPLLFFFAVSQSYALDVTLQWDANTESDLAGYKVYYGTESRYPSNPYPYNGTGATEGDSPIDVGNVTEFPLHLPDGQAYLFAVTAYDTEGFESYYSNEVATYGSGGNGDGCFISTAAPSLISEH